MNHEYSDRGNSHPLLPFLPSSSSSTVDKSTPNVDSTLKSMSGQSNSVKEQQYQYPNSVNRWQKTPLLFSESVASVASVAESHKSDEPSTKKTKTEEVGLPEIPCIFCDYKDCIELDLEFHHLERHRQDLLKLPVGRGSMDYRAECAVAIAKRRMYNGYKETQEKMGYDTDELKDLEKEDQS